MNIYICIIVYLYKTLVIVSPDLWVFASTDVLYTVDPWDDFSGQGTGHGGLHGKTIELSKGFSIKPCLKTGYFFAIACAGYSGTSSP